MDRVLIRNLTVDSLIGVYPEERIDPQRLILDVDMTYDLSAAGLSDNVADTIDYGKVSEELTHIANTTQYQLLEALARDMLLHILSNYPCSEARLLINKPDIMPNGTNVAIELTRSKQQLSLLKDE